MDEIPELIEKIENGDFFEKKNAESRLADIGRPCVPALIKAMESPEIEIQIKV